MHAYIYTRDPSKIFFSPLSRQPRTVGMPLRAAVAKAAAKVAEATVRRLVLGLVAAGAFLFGLRRLGLARRGVLAR